MKSLLTVVIAVNSIECAKDQLNRLNSLVDVVELRFDYLTAINMDEIEGLVKLLNVPYIITVRRRDQGGLFSGTEQERLDLLINLIELKPAYLDIEADVDPAMIDQLHIASPTTQLIASVHDFKQTPGDLDALLNNMQHPAISIYKIVTQANNSIDALRMMAWAKRVTKQCHVVGHCMGEAGQITRITGPIVGNYFIYAAMDAHSEVVKHQVSQQELNETYFIHNKNQDTRLFALIGDPIDASVGHVFHNKYFNEHAINALYIKITLTAEQLPQFFEYCHQLALQGMSVTMPLKKAVLPYVENQANINAVNTLKIADRHISAINTDGIGALNALEQHVRVKDKRILLVGAGGAATAIVDEAIRRGAHVCIANRTKDNAAELAQRDSLDVVDFSSQFKGDVDIVINSIPEASYSHVDLKNWLCDILQHQPVLMNVNYNQSHTILEKLAKQYACAWVAGESMYVQQAKAQLVYWFN